MSAPRPIARQRVVKAPYPDLPETPRDSGGLVTHAEFDRAVFLRRLAEFQAAEKLMSDIWGRRTLDDPARMFLCGSANRVKRSLPEYFNTWMESCGGMAGPGFVPQ